MNWIRFPRLCIPSPSAPDVDTASKKTLTPAVEPQAPNGSAPDSRVVPKSQIGSRMASRLNDMWKQNPKEADVNNKKASRHAKVKINSLPSEKRIYADHVTTLSMDELVAMSSALNIPWTGDCAHLEMKIAARLGKVCQLTNFVFNGATNPHGMKQELTMARIRNNELDDQNFRANFGMTVEQARILKRAQTLANLDIVMVAGGEKLGLALYFDSARAASNRKEWAQALVLRGRIGRNTKEIMNTALGTHGEVFAAVKEAADVLSKLSEQGYFRVDMVAGHSLGGGYAQYFTAAYTSRIKADGVKPAMVLFDPMLLNDRQAADAIKGAPYGYDYSTPRGVAITLNDSKAPAPTLLSRMKGAGFRHPGLVELRLDVHPGDAADNGQGLPVHLGNPSPGWLLGYHDEMSVFEMAIRRFTKKEA